MIIASRITLLLSSRMNTCICRPFCDYYIWTYSPHTLESNKNSIVCKYIFSSICILWKLSSYNLCSDFYVLASFIMIIRCLIYLQTQHIKLDCVSFVKRYHSWFERNAACYCNLPIVFFIYTKQSFFHHLLELHIIYQFLSLLLFLSMVGPL